MGGKSAQSDSVHFHGETDDTHTSVILQTSENLAPRHHCMTASMSSTLNDWTYSSSTSGSLDSRETLAIRRAFSCITRKGAARSSLSLTTCVDCELLSA